MSGFLRKFFMFEDFVGLGWVVVVLYVGLIV